MNASGSGSRVRIPPAFNPLNSNDLRYVVHAGSYQELLAQRRPPVRLQGLGTGLDEAAANNYPDLRNLRTAEEHSRLVKGAST